MKYIDSEKLIDEIERRMEARDDVRTADDIYYPESDFWIRDKEAEEILNNAQRYLIQQFLMEQICDCEKVGIING